MALTADRDTQEFASNLNLKLDLPVLANAVIYRGALVVLTNTGFARNGTTATTHISVGRAEEAVDNTGGLDGAITVRCSPGIFKWDNAAGGDAVAQAHVGNAAFIVDDEAVANAAGGTRSAAGTIVQVDADGVWVAHTFPAANLT